MFFAACELFPSFRKPGEVPPFIQMWDVHDPKLDGIQETRQRAIIVPTYAVVLLADGSNQWAHILKHLVKGDNVLSAVNQANEETGNKWQVFGNQSVTLRSSN